MRTVRNDKRYPIALPLLVKVGARSAERVTRDVSFDGIFVVTDPRPAGTSDLPALSPRQLISITFLLTAESISFTVSAAVVRVERSSLGEGAALRFYGIGRDARQAWDEFVRELSGHDEEQPRGSRAPLGQRFEPLLYRNAHQVAVVRVYFSSVSQIYGLIDAPDSRMFIRSDDPLPLGSEIGLQLVHPDSDDIFELSAFVDRSVDQHGVRGMGVEILDLDAARTERLKEFVEDGLEVLFDEPEVDLEPHSSRR